jgi:hypothetical protein
MATANFSSTTAARIAHRSRPPPHCGELGSSSSWGMKRRAGMGGRPWEGGHGRATNTAFCALHHAGATHHASHYRRHPRRHRGGCAGGRRGPPWLVANLLSKTTRTRTRTHTRARAHAHACAFSCIWISAGCAAELHGGSGNTTLTWVPPAQFPTHMLTHSVRPVTSAGWLQHSRLERLGLRHIREVQRRLQRHHGRA